MPRRNSAMSFTATGRNQTAVRKGAVMGSLDKFLAVLVGHTQGGITALGPSVQGLIGALIVLTYAFMGIKWLVTGADIRSMMAGFFMKSIFVGFFVWMVLHWPEIYTLFPDYMIALGNKANGGAP